MYKMDTRGGGQAGVKKSFTRTDPIVEVLLTDIFSDLSLDCLRRRKLRNSCGSRSLMLTNITIQFGPMNAESAVWWTNQKEEMETMFYQSD